MLYIGTSGFDYPEWKGLFYPSDLKRKDFLVYYSTVFNALEINTSFYNMPTKEQLLSFYERSEGRLSFSLKANRIFTHERTDDWLEKARVFKESVSVLQEKNVLNTILFQFPPTFAYSIYNRKYLGELLKEFSNFSTVIEFRNADWLRPSVFEGLQQRNSSLVFADIPQLLKNVESNLITRFVGPNAYIRFHEKNPNSWYADKALPENVFSEEELKKFIPIIQQAQQENRTVSIFFYNHSQASGALAASKLTSLSKLSD